MAGTLLMETTVQIRPVVNPRGGGLNYGVWLCRGQESLRIRDFALLEEARHYAIILARVADCRAIDEL